MTKELTLKIEEGAVAVEFGYVYKESPNIVALAVQTESNYLEVAGWGEFDDGPALMLDPGEDLSSVNSTIINFIEYKGWDIWSVHVSKDNIFICLTKK